jgi:hypothetical protein
VPRAGVRFAGSFVVGSGFAGSGLAGAPAPCAPAGRALSRAAPAPSSAARTSVSTAQPITAVARLMADGAWQRLAQGQSVTLAPGVVHTFRNPGRAPTRFVTGFAPRGFERFFATFGVPADRPGAPEASVAPAVIERVLREAADFGMYIVAP